MGIQIKIMAVQPLSKVKIVKKVTKHPNRFQSHQWLRVKTSWRRSRGVDNPMRRKFRGHLTCPNIGQKQAKKTRHMLASGFRKLLIQNKKDIELLLMNNRTYCGEIAHNVSSGQRKEIVASAKELNVRLTNAQARMKKAPAK